MGRAKPKMELIPNEKARHLTYFKRKKGLIKKLYEFKTLCGVDTLMIAYGPQQGDRPVEVETYPDKPKEVHEIIKRYQQVPGEDKAKRSRTLKNFFEDEKKKSEAELVMLRGKHQELQHIPLDGTVTVEQLQQLYQKIDVQKVLVEQRIKSMKGMHSSSSVMDGGSKRIAEFPHASAPDLIPYHTSNTYNNHNDNHQTLWRREEMMHAQPFGYQVPPEYHHPNNIPSINHENLSSIPNYSAPMFGNPMMGTDGSSYGYINMGTFAEKNNQLFWDRNYTNQHMGSAMMPSSMYHQMGQMPLFQMPHQLPFMNTAQTHHQQQFRSSGSSSQMMHQQAPSSHFGFHEDQTNDYSLEAATI